MREPVVERLTHDGRSEAVGALAQAFAVDPVWSWMLPRASDRAARLRPLFDALLEVELAKPAHLVDVAGDGAGVAIWHAPDEWQVPPREILRRAPTVLRACRWHVGRLLRSLHAVERVHPAEPHRYLAFLAVHPDQQGRGIGGSLLAAAVERCDEEGLAAYLESSNPRNQGLYARYGFAARDPLTVAAGAPPITPMWRDPR